MGQIKFLKKISGKNRQKTFYSVFENYFLSEGIMPKKCWNRVNRAGVTYVVCNDPPRGSKGQAGVYQAENPTGKQDGRTKRKAMELDKQRVRNRLRKDMLDKEFQINYTEYSGTDAKTNPGIAALELETPKNAPATSTMVRQLRGVVADKNVDGMGRKYIYNQWARKAKEGKAFLKKNKLERPPKFGGINDKDTLEDYAGEIASNFAGGRDVKVPKGMGTGKSGWMQDGGYRRYGIPLDFEHVRRWRRQKEGKKTAVMDKDDVEGFEEDMLRYKHLLELGNRLVPQYVEEVVKGAGYG